MTVATAAAMLAPSPLLAENMIPVVHLNSASVVHPVNFGLIPGAVSQPSVLGNLGALHLAPPISEGSYIGVLPADTINLSNTSYGFHEETNVGPTDSNFPPGVNPQTGHVWREANYIQTMKVADPASNSIWLQLRRLFDGQRSISSDLPEVQEPATSAHKGQQARPFFGNSLVLPPARARAETAAPPAHLALSKPGPLEVSVRSDEDPGHGVPSTTEFPAANTFEGALDMLESINEAPDRSDYVVLSAGLWQTVLTLARGRAHLLNKAGPIAIASIEKHLKSGGWFEPNVAAGLVHLVAGTPAENTEPILQLIPQHFKYIRTAAELTSNVAAAVEVGRDNGIPLAMNRLIKVLADEEPRLLPNAMEALGIILRIAHPKELRGGADLAKPKKNPGRMTPATAIKFLRAASDLAPRVGNADYRELLAGAVGAFQALSKKDLKDGIRIELNRILIEEICQFIDDGGPRIDYSDKNFMISAALLIWAEQSEFEGNNPPNLFNQLHDLLQKIFFHPLQARKQLSPTEVWSNPLYAKNLGFDVVGRLVDGIKAALLDLGSLNFWSAP